MEIIRGLHNLRDCHYGCVATIGNFDGVHIGHQYILQQLLIQSREYDLPALVISFDPQPQEFFTGKHFVRLSRFRDKAELLQEAGIHRILVIHFNQEFSQISADDFVENILLKRLGIKYLLVGDDFCCGKDRKGNFQHLSQKAALHNFKLDKIETIESSAERVSSTRIRKALEHGNMEAARTMLNRPYWLSGHVQHGAKKGRTIGFPTANIPLHRDTPAVRGVYAVKLCKKKQNLVFNGVANIGFRPTVNGTKALLEVHLFDFDQDLYGQLVHVEFLHKIRDEKKFDSFELLKQQILHDVEIAKEYFKKLT
ncbi:MAG: bifunctional riboflavin kinase/FAD synthetase [Pseudomonadota bacterium]